MIFLLLKHAQHYLLMIELTRGNSVIRTTSQDAFNIWCNHYYYELCNLFETFKNGYNYINSKKSSNKKEIDFINFCNFIYNQSSKYLI